MSTIVAKLEGETSQEFFAACKAASIVARHIIHELCIDPEDTIGDWASYPDIGEDDWRVVLDNVRALTYAPGAREYEDAYGLLAGRADDHA